ncbi:hypothetical protein SH661x_004014 [Planctomicrobium sp. SH661]|uniref:hypothetical protein n=1 Tax=Planctomicrobium sp. SH661 TaxID=3448124 RepID=UPI003F5BAED6
MPDIDEVERIQFKMQRIRRHMDDDVNRIQAEAAQLMDWKYYIRRHPIASLAAISAAGFMLVPKSQPPVEKKVYLDPDVSREIVRNTGQVQLHQPEQTVKQGLLFSLGAIALNTLVKAGVAYAGQQMRQTLMKDFTPVDKTPAGNST